MLSDSPTLLPILAAQLWFIAAIALMLYALFLRKQAKRLSQDLTSANETIEQLQQPSESHGGSSAQAESDDHSGADQQALILSYQQRIKNLEKFRSLFFELEKKLNSELGNHANDDERLQDLIRLTAEQERVIAALKNSIEEISRKYSLEHDAKEKLQHHMETLNQSSEALKQKLEGAEKELVKINILETELDHYRKRINELEDSERLLQRKTHELQRDAEALGELKRNPHPYGEVKIQEIEHLSATLQKKEQEIKNLRSECETVARQYEQLATQSVRSIDELTKASQEEQINLQQMQAILERSAVEIAEKDKEIATLESLCMQLKGQDSVNAQQLLDKSIQDRADLQDAIFDIGEKVGKLDTDNQEQLSQLRSTIEEHDQRLAASRADYRETKDESDQKFSDADLMEQELEQLRKENRSLKQSNNTSRRLQKELQERDQEIESLRDEIAMLEERCLELLSRDRD